jgi:hypothetical protein
MTGTQLVQVLFFAKGFFLRPGQTMLRLDKTILKIKVLNLIWQPNNWSNTFILVTKAFKNIFQSSEKIRRISKKSKISRETDSIGYNKKHPWFLTSLSLFHSDEHIWSLIQPSQRLKVLLHKTVLYNRSLVLSNSV